MKSENMAKGIALLFLILLLGASGCLSDGDSGSDGDQETGEGDQEGDADGNGEGALDGDLDPDMAESVTDGEVDGDLDPDGANPDGESDVSEMESSESVTDGDEADLEFTEAEGGLESEEGDSELEENGNAPEITSFNSECLGGKVDEEETLSAKWETDRLTVLHANARYNCCIERIDVAMEVETGLLRLYETEVLETPCDCICPFNVTSEIRSLSPGVYTVEVYKSNVFWNSVNVEVPAISFTASNSECLAQKEGEGEELSASTVDGHLEVLHHNATFNCCIPRVAVEVTQEENHLTIRETEDYGDSGGCFCTCPFDVTTSVYHLASGSYTIDVYALDVLAGTLEYEAP